MKPQILSLALSSVLVLAACGGANGLSVSARVGAPRTAAVRAPASGQSLTLSNGVVLERVRVVFSDIKLEKEHGDANLETDDEDVRTGPVLLDLGTAALDGSVTKVVDAPIAAGTYKEIKFKIDKPSASDSGVAANAALKAMADAGASIIVDGTIDGVAFSFATAQEAQQKFEGAIVLGDGSNLTINLDASTWFGGAGSGRFDPRVSGDRSKIEEAIKRSFKAFRDEDHDGKDD